MGFESPSAQCMLRTDTWAQLKLHRYYRVLGHKSEGGTGDSQIKVIGPMIDA